MLNQKTGPVFGDAELEQYVERKVICDGFLVGTTLLEEWIQVVEEHPLMSDQTGRSDV